MKQENKENNSWWRNDQEQAKDFKELAAKNAPSFTIEEMNITSMTGDQLIAVADMYNSLPGVEYRSPPSFGTKDIIRNASYFIAIHIHRQLIPEHEEMVRQIINGEECNQEVITSISLDCGKLSEFLYKAKTGVRGPIEMLFNGDPTDLDVLRLLNYTRDKLLLRLDKEVVESDEEKEEQRVHDIYLDDGYGPSFNKEGDAEIIEQLKAKHTDDDPAVTALSKAFEAPSQSPVNPYDTEIPL